MASKEATEAAARAIEGISWAKWPDSTETAMAEGAGIDFARAALDAGRPYLVADELDRFKEVMDEWSRTYGDLDWETANLLLFVTGELKKKAAELRAEVSDGQ